VLPSFYGGRSGEHEVSLVSAEAVIAALNPERYEVARYLIGKDGRWNPRPILPEPGAHPDIDVVFPVLHGTFARTARCRVCRTGGSSVRRSQVLASSLSMDKDAMKRICRERGLPVVEYMVMGRDAMDAEAVARTLPFPIFVKPANLGSSVGISKAHNLAELEAALKLAAEFDRKNRRGTRHRRPGVRMRRTGQRRSGASVPCEILPSREFYDYEDKYELNLARTVVPPDLQKDARSTISQAGGRVLQSGWLRRHGAGGLSARGGDRQILHQRDQYDSRFSRRSACNRRCGRTAECPIPN